MQRLWMSDGFKAVCYQCSFEGRVTTTRCPVCHFPIILERENTPPGGARLSEIFARASVRAGAPPLPGVDAEKRKAQLLAEQRAARRSQARPVAERLALRVPPPPPEAPSLLVRLRVPLLCLSAALVGVLAAALHSSL
jgi:hypothetical protein